MAAVVADVVDFQIARSKKEAAKVGLDCVLFAYGRIRLARNFVCRIELSGVGVLLVDLRRDLEPARSNHFERGDLFPASFFELRIDLSVIQAGCYLTGRSLTDICSSL